jgi:hypothetical protein
MVNTLKIPKKIAGVKVPKQVRKKAKKAIRAGAGPVVREIAAAAIGAANAKATRDRAAAEERPFDGRVRIHVEGDRIAQAFRDAALNGLRSFLEGLEEGLGKAEARARGDDPQPEPQAKPRAAKKPNKPNKPKKLKTASAAKPGSRAPGA